MIIKDLDKVLNLGPHKVTFLKSFLENQQTETNYKLLTVTAYNLVKNM